MRTTGPPMRRSTRPHSITRTPSFRTLRKILKWTDGAEAFYGWTRAEALGRNSHELLDVSLPDPLEKIRATLLATGSWTGEFRQRCRDGSIMWVAGHWSVLRDNAGEPVAVIKMNNDITALKTAEATARSLFENATPGILTVDQAGRIVNVNAMAMGLFGYTREEMIGMAVEMLLPEALRARHVGHRAGYALRPHARLMRLGLDLIARRKDGTEFPVEISLGSVAEHPGGGIVHRVRFGHHAPASRNRSRKPRRETRIRARGERQSC